MSALPLAAGRRDAFRPKGEDGPVYFLRIASVLDAEDFQVATAMAGATYPSDLALCDLMVREIEAFGGETDKLVEVVLQAREHFKDQVEKPGGQQEPLPADLAKLFNEIGVKLHGFSPEYRGIIARRRVFFNKVALVAASQFLSGWDGLADAAGEPIIFARDEDSGLVTEDAMKAAIERDKPEILSAGFRALALMQAGADTRKNSQSLSRSTPSPIASQGIGQSTTAGAGSSTAKSTRKTPRKR